MSFLFNRLGHLFLLLLAVLPYSWVVNIGYAIGRLGPIVAPKRDAIVKANLRACFPHFSQEKVMELANQHWRLFGRSLAERGRVWLGSAASIQEFVEFKSDVDLADGQPRLFVGMHMVGIEAGLLAFTIRLQELKARPGITLYVRMTNAYFEQKIKAWRERFGARMLLRQNQTRELIREIRKGTVVLISPDMDLGLNDSIFVPFFGFPTNTVTSLSRLARASGAQVCPVVTTLKEGGSGYICHVGQPWQNYPTDDIEADTLRMNQFFETQIRPRIAEYYWVHKRFKNRPEGQPSIY